MCYFIGSIIEFHYSVEVTASHPCGWPRHQPGDVSVGEWQVGRVASRLEQ